MRTLRDFGTYEFICGQSGNNATKNIRLATIDCEGMLAVALAFVWGTSKHGNSVDQWRERSSEILEFISFSIKVYF